MNEEPKKNPYIQFPSREEDEYWTGASPWYRERHQRLWYDRLDLEAIYQASNDDVLDVIHKFITYCRIRDRVIENRHAIAYHVGLILDMAIHGKFSAEELRAQLKLINEYLLRMQVKSGLEPNPPIELPKDTK